MFVRKPEEPPDIPLAEMNDEQLLNFINYHYQAECSSQGKLIQGLARFTELRLPKRPGIHIGDGAAEEIALELCMSPTTAARKLCQAKTMAARLPNTVDALAAGEIDYMRAKAMHDATAELELHQASEVEKRVLDDGRQESLLRFKLGIKREVLRADPDAEQRRQFAKADRNVIGTDRPDGMACLDVILEPHEAQAAYDQINLLANQAKTPERSLAQCRADVFMDLVMGKSGKRAAVNVNVLVPLSTRANSPKMPHGGVSSPIRSGKCLKSAANVSRRRGYGGTSRPGTRSAVNLAVKSPLNTAKPTTRKATPAEELRAKATLPPTASGTT